MTRHTPDMLSASDWSWRLGNLIQPIRSTTQIWVVTRHQYGISALVSQTSFGGEPTLASSNVGRFLRLLKNRKVKFRSKSLYSYQVSSIKGNAAFFSGVFKPYQTFKTTAEREKKQKKKQKYNQNTNLITWFKASFDNYERSPKVTLRILYSNFCFKEVWISERYCCHIQA